MAGTTRIDGNLHIAGILTADVNALGESSTEQGAELVEHEHRFGDGQAVGVNNATLRQVVFVARKAGEIIDFEAGHTAVATGTGNTTIDLLKNGVSILSAVITLTNQTVRVAVNGTLTGDAVYAAGDVFEVNIVATAGSGIAGQGVFYNGSARESGAN